MQREQMAGHIRKEGETEVTIEINESETGSTTDNTNTNRNPSVNHDNVSRATKTTRCCSKAVIIASIVSVCIIACAGGLGYFGYFHLRYCENKSLSTPQSEPSSLPKSTAKFPAIDQRPGPILPEIDPTRKVITFYFSPNGEVIERVPIEMLGITSKDLEGATDVEVNARMDQRAWAPHDVDHAVLNAVREAHEAGATSVRLVAQRRGSELALDRIETDDKDDTLRARLIGRQLVYRFEKDFTFTNSRDTLLELRKMYSRMPGQQQRGNELVWALYGRI